MSVWIRVSIERVCREWTFSVDGVAGGVIITRGGGAGAGGVGQCVGGVLYPHPEAMKVVGTV